MMPEFKDSGLWLKTGEDRLKLLLNTLVYPDGTPKEISCDYHLANAVSSGAAVNVAAENGLSLDPQLKQMIEKMYEVVMFSSRPGFGSVGFGDSKWSVTAVPNAAEQVKDLFPHREDFKFFATKGAAGESPPFTSWMSPWAGHAHRLDTRGQLSGAGRRTARHIPLSHRQTGHRGARRQTDGAA